MDMVHTYVEVQDSFPFPPDRKIVTVTEDNFNKMVKGIGTDFAVFNKKTQIHSHYTVKIVRRATEQDYIDLNIKQFTNE